MPFREALKVLAEEHIERETADCTRDRNQFRGHLLTHFKTKSRSDPANEGQQCRRAFLRHSLLRDVGHGFPCNLR